MDLPPGQARRLCPAAPLKTAAVSHHLRVLIEAGLLHRQRRGHGACAASGARRRCS
ncbi:MAG: ArsR family transcriptional regulator, partial [Actinophytocola sp.]|nr:ArsR family transcriptional regulator [Actinophytocola sp.]